MLIVMKVHRSIIPYFTPSPSTLIDTVTTLTFDDLDAIDPAKDNYYYFVLARDDCGAVSGNSNGIAKFDFTIEAGY